MFLDCTLSLTCLYWQCHYRCQCTSKKSQSTTKVSWAAGVRGRWKLKGSKLDKYIWQLLIALSSINLLAFHLFQQPIVVSVSVTISVLLLVFSYYYFVYERPTHCSLPCSILHSKSRCFMNDKSLEKWRKCDSERDWHGWISQSSTTHGELHGFEKNDVASPVRKGEREENLLFMSLTASCGLGTRMHVYRVLLFKKKLRR